MKLPALTHLLEYKNPAVLKLYEQNYPNNKLSADAAFVHVLKYLWLSKKHSMELIENKIIASSGTKGVYISSTNTSTR